MGAFLQSAKAYKSCAATDTTEKVCWGAPRMEISTSTDQSQETQGSTISPLYTSEYVRALA